jgi:hypothetical protein
MANKTDFNNRFNKASPLAYKRFIAAIEVFVEQNLLDKKK